MVIGSIVCFYKSALDVRLHRVINVSFMNSVPIHQPTNLKSYRSISYSREATSIDTSSFYISFAWRSNAAGKASKSTKDVNANKEKTVLRARMLEFILVSRYDTSATLLLSSE